MHYPALTATVLAGLLAACAATPGSGNAPSLEGSQWHLSEVSGIALDIPPSPSIDLRFLDGRVHFYGCNALSGRYVQSGRHLEVPKGFVGTRMSCNDELMAIDAAGTGLFEAGVDFRHTSDTLTLSGNGQRWVFERDDADD